MISPSESNFGKCKIFNCHFNETSFQILFKSERIDKMPHSLVFMHIQITLVWCLFDANVCKCYSSKPTALFILNLFCLYLVQWERGQEVKGEGWGKHHDLGFELGSTEAQPHRVGALAHKAIGSFLFIH